MRFAAWTTGTLAGVALVFMLAVLVSARPGDPKLFPAREGEQSLEVLLVNNGYHSGLVLPRASVATLAAAQGQSAVAAIVRRFTAYDWVEVGWGEARFYREVPTIDRLSWRLALSALFGRDNEAVLHVVGLWDEPQEVFRSAERVSLRISAEGAARLLARLNGTIAVSPAGQPEELGPGLYGPSLFYRVKGRFNIFNVCNHWIADLLDAAGVPTSPVLATLPRGLVLDLRWRSQLTSLPAS
jgi:uncharacterized protein (TIGR02117 family)